MADFIPPSDTDLLNWLANFKTKIAIHGLTLGMTPEKIAQLIAFCDGITVKIQLVEQKKAELAGAVTAKLATRKTNITALRTEINVIKVNTLLTGQMIDELQIMGEEGAFNPETYKPEISGQVFSGFVRIKFTKKGVDGVKIYVRLKGQTVWRLLTFDTNSPYDDFTALATPGVAEVREYQAFGVIDDVQIGQPSDIASVTFAG